MPSTLWSPSIPTKPPETVRGGAPLDLAAKDDSVWGGGEGNAWLSDPSRDANDAAVREFGSTIMLWLRWPPVARPEDCADLGSSIRDDADALLDIDVPPVDNSDPLWEAMTPLRGTIPGPPS